MVAAATDCLLLEVLLPPLEVYSQITAPTCWHLTAALQGKLNNSNGRLETRPQHMLAAVR